MSSIEFRRRRSEDEMEPFYVRIAETGDGAPLAFTETTDSIADLDAAVAALRAGTHTTDRLHDQANDKWFFRFKHAESGELLFRSMPCDTEFAMEEAIGRIMREAPSAPQLDDT